MPSSGKLEDRVQRELAAHTDDDVLARSHALKDRFPHVRRYPSLRRMMAELDHHLETVAGKFVLDLGCGNGERSLQMLRRGARVVGIDISPVYIQHATTAAEGLGLANGQFEFRAMDAHQLEFADNTFDMVVGNGILHHLDLQASTEEIQRVLKAGGRSLFVEPLAANPLLQIFRWLTPNARTEDEQPLTPVDLGNFAQDRRWSVESSYCGVIAAPVAVATSLLMRRWPNNPLLQAADWVESKLHDRQWLNPMNQYVLLNLVKS